MVHIRCICCIIAQLTILKCIVIAQLTILKCIVVAQLTILKCIVIAQLTILKCIVVLLYFTFVRSTDVCYLGRFLIGDFCF